MGERAAIRLLCVEDDPLVRTYLTTRLSLEPDILVAAGVPGAAEALAFLREERVDLILLDYLLEGADGMQLLGILRQNPPPDGGPPPRVLFCTGHADAAFDARARAMGAAGVIPKERMATELVPAVRAVAAGGLWFTFVQAEAA